MAALNVDGIGLGDPQSLINQITADTDPNDLIKLQLQVGQFSMMYTATSGIVSSVIEAEKGIAQKLG